LETSFITKDASSRHRASWQACQIQAPGYVSLAMAQQSHSFAASSDTAGEEWRSGQSNNPGSNGKSIGSSPNDFGSSSGIESRSLSPADSDFDKRSNNQYTFANTGRGSPHSPLNQVEEQTVGSSQPSSEPRACSDPGMLSAADPVIEQSWKRDVDARDKYSEPDLTDTRVTTKVTWLRISSLNSKQDEIEVVDAESVVSDGPVLASRTNSICSS